MIFSLSLNAISHSPPVSLCCTTGFTTSGFKFSLKRRPIKLINLAAASRAEQAARKGEMVLNLPQMALLPPPPRRICAPNRRLLTRPPPPAPTTTTLEPNNRRHRCQKVPFRRRRKQTTKHSKLREEEVKPGASGAETQQNEGGDFAHRITKSPLRRRNSQMDRSLRRTRNTFLNQVHMYFPRLFRPRCGEQGWYLKLWKVKLVVCAGLSKPCTQNAKSGLVSISKSRASRHVLVRACRSRESAFYAK